MLSICCQIRSSKGSRPHKHWVYLSKLFIVGIPPTTPASLVPSACIFVRLIGFAYFRHIPTSSNMSVKFVVKFVVNIIFISVICNKAFCHSIFLISFQDLTDLYNHYLIVKFCNHFLLLLLGCLSIYIHCCAYIRMSHYGLNYFKIALILT